MSNISVLFVCLGNICRSPTAHAVFQALVDNSGLAEQIKVDSAGTGDWHIGHAPDQRTCTVSYLPLHAAGYLLGPSQCELAG